MLRTPASVMFLGEVVAIGSIIVAELSVTLVGSSISSVKLNC